MAGLEWFMLAGLLGGILKSIHDGQGFLKLPKIDQEKGLYLGFLFNAIIGLMVGYGVFVTQPNVPPWVAFTTGLSGSAIIEAIADNSFTKPSK
jgi:hypothetical protein